jgi:hypothetical protein
MRVLAFAVAVLLSAITPIAANAAVGDHPETQVLTDDGNAGRFGPLLPRDLPVDVRGVQAVCTGLDPASRDDPRWQAYPLRLEFLDAKGSPIPFAQIAVTDMKGLVVVSVRCPAPWLLLGLPAGDYKASVASSYGADQSIGFVVPREGQKSVMVRFGPQVQGRAILGLRP